MTSPLGRPLDRGAAADRAQQIRAVADPIRLRLLSLLVADPDGSHAASSVAAAVEIGTAEAAAHLLVLREVGLVASVPGSGEATYRPTPDAWVRFGRLVTAPVAPSERGPDAIIDAAVQLPPEVLSMADRLAYRFKATFSAETVHKYVADSYQLLRQRGSVTRHLPSLTSRFATDRLSALATMRGLQTASTPEVLIVCVRNAGRSQIAAAVLAQLGGDRVHVRTAGSSPVAAVDRAVVEALDEIGVPLAGEFPKPLTDEVVQAADVVVTMGCGDACPVYPGRRYMDWPIADPVGRPVEEVRAIRDDIIARVEGLLVSLGFEPPAHLLASR